MTDPQLPRAAIGWIVDRYHVSASAEDIRDDILRRCENNADADRWTPRLRAAAVRHALARHEANRALYRTVTGQM